jgi:hypothetical protein
MSDVFRYSNTGGVTRNAFYGVCAYQKQSKNEACRQALNGLRSCANSEVVN